MKKIFSLILIIPTSVIANLSILTVHEDDYFLGAKENESSSRSVVSELLKRSNITFNIEVKPFKRAVYEAKLKRDTCVMPINRNQERETVYKWIGPLFISEFAIYSLEEKNIQVRKLEDIVGQTVIVNRGSHLVEYLKSFKIKTLEVGKPEAGRLVLFKKRLNLWAIETHFVNSLNKNIKEKVRKNFTFSKMLGGLACNKNIDPKLIDTLNKNLRIMYKDGSIKIR